MTIPEDVPRESEIIEGSLPKDLRRGWSGLWYRIRENFIPEIHYLEDEELELSIHMAEYRRTAPLVISRFALLLEAIALPLAIASFFVPVLFRIRFALVGAAVLIIALLISQFQNLLLYEQWRFIVTDKRIILVTPAPNRSWLADAIYLKRGKIQVLDTNWSQSVVWGLFQAYYGSRDVMLSMAAYEFQEQGAQVKGGLRFPDVMPLDILRLEELIFG